MVFAKDDYTIKTVNGQLYAIIRSDGASIPVCPGNMDYDEFILIDGDAQVCERVDVTPEPPVPDDTQDLLNYVRAQVNNDTTGMAAAKANIQALKASVKVNPDA